MVWVNLIRSQARWRLLPGFVFSVRPPDIPKGDVMANHFTPEELAKDLGMDARELIAFCLRESIPIYKGKVDRSLLTAVMRSKGLAVPAPQPAAC